MYSIPFSFVMPAFKKKFLYQAIECIMKQSYHNFELIIVNDASPENLEEVISKFKDKRIRYIVNDTNIGGHDLVANWNQCIQFANHDYIILATDDDLYEPHFLSDAIGLIKKYPEVKVIRSGVKKIDEQGNTVDIEFPLKEYMSSREFMLFYAKGGIISCVSNYIFKKDALKNNGGFISFPFAHYSDDATALSLSNKGIACIPSNHVCFRVSRINLSNRNDTKLVIGQLQATESYMNWILKHINSLDTNKNDYFETACYGGIKVRYIAMLENLICKISLRNITQAIGAIISAKYLFRKEKLKLIACYFINKL